MDLAAIASNTIKIILLLGLPSLLVSMIIGLIISIFQAVTQISDASLAFVPKMIFVSMFIVFTLPWMSSHVEVYTLDLWDNIIKFGQH
jgi:flagellar biosynthetic protein FliQ